MATTNALLFYDSQYRNALFSLYQRDRLDAADPFAMLWYGPNIAGSWFRELPLDKSFQDASSACVANMRSS
jgi:hypothetical protein